MRLVQQGCKWLSILGLPVVGAYIWWSSVSAPSQSTAKAVQIKITPGTATQKIGRNLAAVGLIRSQQAWDLWARWLQWQDPKGEFKSGTYQLSPTQPLSVIAETIWQGKVVQQNFTIPEGWSLRQMAAHFESMGFFPATDFLAAVNQIDRNQYPWLPADLPHLEGFLYPDTYQLNGDSITPQVVVKQMLNRFEQVALPLYQQGQQRTQLDLRQWVTLASIVEKEAVLPRERPRIAGVFSQRLRRGVPLGADPTVEYGLGIRQTVDQPLTLAAVNTPSPYNTYLNPGLPPTPIASPGLASLKATLYPEDTSYLYFVARYDGTHVFSRTLSEHQAAQNTIRKQQKVRSKE